MSRNEADQGIGDNIPLPGPIMFFFEFKRHLGFSLPDDIETVFSTIHKFLQSEDAADIRSRLNPTITDGVAWYNMFHGAIIGDCYRQAGACLYHLEKLTALENQAIKLIRDMTSTADFGQHMALSAEKIDFEFHALVLAIKAYLSYLARAVFIFFKSERHTFDKYEKYLLDRRPQEYSEKIISILDEQWERLSTYYSVGDRKSLRDTITHNKFVGAGWINIYGGVDVKAGYALPSEIIRNEVMEPEFAPHKIDENGLGVAKLMQDHVSYTLTLSTHIFRALGVFK